MTKIPVALGVSAALSLLFGLRLDGGLVSLDWDALSRAIPEAIILGLFMWYQMKTQETTKSMLKDMSESWKQSITQLVTNHRAASEKRDAVTIAAIDLIAKSNAIFSEKLDTLNTTISDLTTSMELGFFKSVLDEDKDNGANSSIEHG